MLDERHWPSSLVALSRAALRDFPDAEQDIRHYIRELSHVLYPAEAPSSAGAGAAEAADATCSLTGEDSVTLLFKFEAFLESLLVAGDRRGVTRGR